MANKRLGQHFLKDEGVAQKIIAALNVHEGETVIEIGPGGGALTFPLLEVCRTKKCRLIAIEKDRNLAQNLRTIKGIEELEVVEGDALTVLPQTVDPVRSRESSQRASASNGVDNLWKSSYKLVGNIPYYLTGKLLRIVGELKNRPILTVFMVQKEVAERIIAKPPHMNLLAASIQIWAKPELLFSIPKGVFDPPPEVNSVVIRLITKKNPDIPPHYYEMVRILFKQPRKMLINNLSEGLGVHKDEARELLLSLGLDKKTRPHNLSIEHIIAFAKKLEGWG